MEKMEVISLKLPKSLKKQLDYVSNTHNLTRSSFIRKLIESNVYKRNTKYDTALLVFLIGTTTILTTVIIKSYLNRKKLSK